MNEAFEQFAEIWLPDTIAVGKGSFDAYVNKRTGKAGVKNNNKKTKPFQQQVALAARQAMAGKETIAKPRGAYVYGYFVLPRPQSHYSAKGLILSRFADLEHTVKPDGDKLLRTCYDALSGIVYDDDAQVCWGSASKRYVEEHELPSVLLEIHVRPLR